MDKQGYRDNFFKLHILYMLVMLLFITVGYFTQLLSFSSGILITEFLIIALPAILYIGFTGGSYKERLRLNKLSLVDIILVITIFCCGYFVAAFVNIIGLVFLTSIGKLIPSNIPIPKTGGEYVVAILLIAGTAGLCEELLFRGCIMRGYEKLGMWKSIFVTAVLFAALHLNIQNFLGPLFLGVILGFVVYKTNSIFAGILGHFINNAISVTIGFLLSQSPAYKSLTPEQLNASPDIKSMIVILVFIGIIAAAAGLIMVFCMMALADRCKFGWIFREAELGKIIKDINLMWPILVTSAIFVFFMGDQLHYIVTGESVIKSLINKAL